MGVLEGLFQVKGTKSRMVLVYVWMQWATQAITSRTCAAEPRDVLQVLFEIPQARHCWVGSTPQSWQRGAGAAQAECPVTWPTSLPYLPGWVPSLAQPKDPPKGDPAVLSHPRAGALWLCSPRPCTLPCPDTAAAEGPSGHPTHSDIKALPSVS